MSENQSKKLLSPVIHEVSGGIRGIYYYYTLYVCLSFYFLLKPQKEEINYFNFEKQKLFYV